MTKQGMAIVALLALAITGIAVTSQLRRDTEPRVYTISRICPAGISQMLRRDPTLTADAVFISEMCDDAHAYVAYVIPILGPKGDEMACQVLRDNLPDPARTKIFQQLIDKSVPHPLCQPYAGGGCLFLDLLSKYLVIELHETLRDEVHLNCYEIHYTGFAREEQDRIGAELRSLLPTSSADGSFPTSLVPAMERGGVGCRDEDAK